ncbi:hypothetical protein Q7P35_001269 [Cladosporium inversicolor]
MVPPRLDEPTHKATQTWLLEHLKQHSKSPYPFLPLNPHLQEIRLFRLEGGKGRLRGSLVVCSLERYQEDQKHGQGPTNRTSKTQRDSQTEASQPDFFEALSYTWGSSQHSESVQVQSHVCIPITDNLARALRRLRHRSTQQPRHLWIDAICIDQQNLAERSQQVAFMCEIYQRAHRVIIWLGDLPDDLSLLSRALFAVILRLPQIVRSRHLHVAVLQQCRRSFKQALESTLRTSRPRWHERVWTVQEFVHARRAVYYHGPFQWDDLPDLMLQYDSGPRADDMPCLKAFFESFTSLTQLRGLGRLSLHQATVWISKRECVDPRDKVYGLLSILPRQIAGRVVVDYTRTPEEVFVDATYAALLATDDMDILTLVRVSEGQRSLLLPTWAVDFAALAKREVGAQFGLAHHNGSVWHARFAKPQEGPCFSRNGRDLAVLGSRFDVVEDTVSVPLSETAWQAPPSIQQAIEMLRRLVQKLHAKPARPKTVYQKIVWVTSLQPDPRSAEISIDLEPNEHESNWRRHNDPISFLEKVALEGNKLCEVTHQPIHSEMKSYQRYLESASDHATLVVSVAGLLAIAPGIVREGDIIAMLAGAHGPVMLRPEGQSGTFAFRGFVLLASYGYDFSLQDFWTRNGIDVERFTLR